MKKQIVLLGMLTATTLAFGQKRQSDTLNVQQIEDINLHKTGNPNKARPLTIKSNLTIMETPQPVVVIPHEIIEQQQAKQLSDVLQNVNGMYITSSRGGSQDSFGGRGFSFGNDNIYKNGARVNSGVFPEVSGLERVEALKGANAMLYGNTAAGGIINMITKKPRFNFGGSAGFSFGSWDSYKPTVDVYGPLTAKSAFRFNGAYETAGSFRDMVSSTKHYFNPSFLFNIGSKSQLIIEGDYLKNHFTPDFGIGSLTKLDKSYALNDRLPVNAFLGTSWQYQDVQQATTDIIFNTEFSPKWSLNAVASYQNFTRDYFSTERVVWTEQADHRYGYVRPLNRSYNEQNYTSAQVNINGDVYTGKIQHKILIGADADYSAADSYTYFNPKTGQTYGSTPFNTNGSATGMLYMDDPATWKEGPMPASEKDRKTRINTRRIGVYVQDFVSLTTKFKVLAGIRWSYLENMPSLVTDFRKNTKTATPNSATYDRAFSPRVGLVFTPDQNFSVYATYTNSFSANIGVTSAGLANLDTTGTLQQVTARINALPQEGLNPTTIDQYEIGVKKNFWNNALAVNISGYQIMYNKYYQTFWYLDAKGAVQSPVSTMKEFAGKMRSRGVELDIQGTPMKSLSLIGGFSYNNSVYVDTPDNGYIEKQRLVRTPATTANASVFYTFDRAVKGLKIGAGAYYVGGRIAGWNDTKSALVSRPLTRQLDLTDYTTVSASLGYECRNFSVMAKLNNIFNVVNYNVHETYSVNPIAPRNFYVTLAYKL